MPSLKSLFLLDPDIVFLNHGSFGACSRPVFEEYQRWQSELERRPVEFLGRRADSLMAGARAKLATFLGAEADDVVYFPNPTTAMNMVARSLGNLVLRDRGGDPLWSPFRFGPGDEILTTDHEYGAMDRTWKHLCERAGAKYVHQPIPLPVTSHEEFVGQFWAGVTDRTRIIFISHITSATALTFPVEEICRRAREAGILSIVDGAHAPGQIPVNLAEIGADIYTAALHKWLCAPPGSAFLHARKDVQGWLEPLVVSWGWESEKPSGSQFVDWHEWQGTRELASFLATPAAIEFQAEHDWESVRRRCHELAVETRARVNALTGLAPICPDGEEWFAQMASIRLPDVDLVALKQRLYDEFRVEVPIFKWNDQSILRVSFQGYNTREDADRLVEGLRKLL